MEQLGLSNLVVSNPVGFCRGWSGCLRGWLRRTPRRQPDFRAIPTQLSGPICPGESYARRAISCPLSIRQFRFGRELF
ncbi:hypothetical protein B0H12DRAFT_1151778 [Mycena haematopus]|nr:hypothetical protein B0H12DRAFT_1151778 [Mycena haematopus]